MANLDFEEIDDFLGDEEANEDEAEQRRSTLRPLATVRLRLAEACAHRR